MRSLILFLSLAGNRGLRPHAFAVLPYCFITASRAFEYFVSLAHYVESFILTRRYSREVQPMIVEGSIT